MRKYIHTERDSRKIIQRLHAEGWILVSTRGSHHKFRRNGLTLIVPHPKRDIAAGTVRAIAVVAGWLPN